METLPDGCTVAEVTRSDGVVAPAIWVGAQGDVTVLAEPLALAFSEVDQQRPYQRVAHLIASIAQLLVYYIAKKRPLLDKRGFQSFLKEYILKRANGDSIRQWAPLSRRALAIEVRNIAEYSDFCEREYGHLPLLERCTVPLPAPIGSQRSFWRLMACNERDLFSHLAIRREVEQGRIKIPRRANKGGGADGLVGMTEDFAWKLIDAERNPTFKALWLLGYFGGPRLSESMNLWICDVLPGRMRSLWFPGDIFFDLPLVVIANPWESHWCGKVGDERITREEYLLKEYGLRPRPLMAETEGGEYRGKAAGFKGTKPTNRSGAMRQIFWASEEAARLFETSIAEVRIIRNRMPRAK